MWRKERESGGGGESYFCNLGKTENSSSRTEYYRTAGQSSLKPGPSRVNGDERDPLCTSRVPRISLSNNISTLPWVVGVRYTLHHFLGSHSALHIFVYFRCSDIINEPNVWRRHFKLTKLHKHSRTCLKTLTSFEKSHVPISSSKYQFF